MDWERLKGFFNLSEWGFSRYERYALGLFVILIIIGSLIRFNRHQALVEYSALYVQPSSDTLSTGVDSTLITGEPLVAGSVSPRMIKRDNRKGKLSHGETININSAGIDQLSRLPGIGKVKAQAIIDYRTAYGNYQSADDLDNIKGIGTKTVAKLRPLVRTTDPPE